LSPSSANNPLSQVPNPSVAALYEDALVYETGSAITSTGALTAYSGAKTGRSPLDKRIVKEPGSENDIWWGYAHPFSTLLVFWNQKSNCSQTCQQADDTRCKTPFPQLFTIPWPCTGLSLKPHGGCRSFFEIAIAFQTQWSSTFTFLYTIAPSQLHKIFPFPRSSILRVERHTSVAFLPQPRIFVEGSALTRYYVIASLPREPLPNLITCLIYLHLSRRLLFFFY
jgi:hypothetical protein